MNITPLDIRQKQFKLKFRGFDINEVDAFLEDVTESLEASLRESESLRERIVGLEAEIDSYRESEQALRDTLMSAQKMAEQMRAASDRESQMKIKEAELEAEKIVQDASRTLAKTREEIAELKRIKERFAVKIRGVIDEHMKMLNYEAKQPSD